MRTFLWDFHGPDARGTAEHFQRHLEQFLGREALSGCRTGVREEGPTHWAAWCASPPAWEEPIRKALRPRREQEAPPST